jgi:hypothetical protein
VVVEVVLVEEAQLLLEHQVAVENTIIILEHLQ